MPHICASIRGSGFLSNEEIVLMYDAFTNGKRRTSPCPATVNAEFRESGGCDRRQHDPLYWLISCDEFPMNSVLEGGKANGAIVNAVPEREQQFQLLNSANESAAITAAAQTIVNTAKAAAIAAAATAAAAIANNSAAMASAIASANVAQSAVQSAISTLTDIFGAGTMPARLRPSSRRPA
ncbi:hypothetical protein DFH09DRAFT_1075241 [Mycena vulgaris]|nr:hypothetical protein DFH09DRAFT_1075241 [Mycena vulgaris]